MSSHILSRVVSNSHSEEKLPSIRAQTARWRTWICWLIPLVALAIYSNTFRVPFLFDDFSSIVENATIRSWRTAFFPPVGGLTVSARPVVNFSLALNYAISGYQTWSYHGFNLAIHVANAWLLFAIVRRTLRQVVTANLFRLTRSGVTSVAAESLAAVVAFLWLVHPLQIESVTYLAQRAESLVSFFYLLALYGFIRAVENTANQRWFLFSWLAMAAGMATKEIMVTAPVLIFLYDRFFWAGSFRQAWRDRARVYLGYATTWLILGGLVWSAGGRGGTAGFGLQVSPYSYALTQGEAIVRYLGLSLWPHPLVFDYGTYVTTNMTWSALVLALLIAILVALYRGKLVGFFGSVFFLLLAPTSSFIPVATQTLAEHRMYLPLATVIAFAVFACNYSLGRRSLAFFFLTAVALGTATYVRNQIFQHPLLLWQETVTLRPENSRARYLLAAELVNAGRSAEAVGQVEAAAKIAPDNPDVQHNLAVIFQRVDRPADAIAAAEVALRLQPHFVDAHVTLGNALVKVGRVPEGVVEFQRALRLQPNSPSAENNLAGALMQLGRSEEALQAFAAALRLAPADPLVHANFADALLRLNRPEEAVIEAKSAVLLGPDLPVAHYILSRALLRMNRAVESRAEAETALRLQPNYADAQLLLAELSLRSGLTDEALQRYVETLRSAPNSLEAHFNYANALLQLGRAVEAVPHYEAVLRLKPDLAKAAYNLGHAWLQQNRLAEAAQAFQSASQIEPGNLNARFNLGTIYLQAGNFDAAVTEFSEIVHRDPNSVDGHAMLARALLEATRVPEAIEEFEQALRLKPNDAELQAELLRARSMVPVKR